MITELRVRDLATIADVTLQLGPGLNVLTGETGAGKSMLVDALALLLGERAASGSVRPGAPRRSSRASSRTWTGSPAARIEELGLDLEDGRLIVRREVSAEGRSRAWVNGSPTTATVLGELGALLVDLHGQHETQSLLHAEAQRDILDAFAHAEAERAAVAEAHAALHALRAEEAGLAAKRDEVRRRADYLRHVVNEIDAAKLKPGEDEALQVEARRLGQAGALVEHAQRIADALEGEGGNALGAVSVADRALAALEKVDPAVAGWREMLDAAYANLSELARLAAAYAEEVQEDPGAPGGGRAPSGPHLPAHPEVRRDGGGGARGARRVRRGARSPGHRGRGSAGAGRPPRRRRGRSPRRGRGAERAPP